MLVRGSGKMKEISKNIKRFLSLFLAILILFTIIPLTSYGYTDGAGGSPVNGGGNGNSSIGGNGGGGNNSQAQGGGGKGKITVSNTFWVLNMKCTKSG